MRFPETNAAWKRLQPNNLREASRYCKEYARAFKRLTIPAVAELMGVTEDTLYKWLSTGNMPATMIPVYENVCGIDFITQYLALRSHKLLIDIPIGKKATPIEIGELQSVIAKGMSLLISLYQDGGDANEVAEVLTKIMAGVAYHRENIKRQPELDLFEDAL
ncbi:MAG: hypothetical protein OEX07_15420 [Gammaproteobacteria bacterium]|nr:hypothetical protein [Gammaproteobacteria bacterium]